METRSFVVAGDIFMISRVGSFYSVEAGVLMKQFFLFLGPKFLVKQALLKKGPFSPGLLRILRDVIIPSMVRAVTIMSIVVIIIIVIIILITIFISTEMPKP